MILLDMRTIIFSYVITDIVCLMVMVLLWRQSRKHFAGTAFWVIDFVFQMSALFLIILRGSIPDWMSFVLANTLAIAGALLGYMGLLRFVGKRSSQIHNYILLAVFAFVHAYFTFLQPNPAARNLNLSVGLLIICFQCAWLMLYRAAPGVRRLTRGVGIVFAAFCVLSAVRIGEFFTGAHSVSDYFQSGLFEQLVLLSNQMLLILLTFSLALMFNKRLMLEISTQEEKFSKAFHSSPYAITITRLADGRIIEVNDGFFSITGYEAADLSDKTTLSLHLWDGDEDRAAVVSELASKGKVRDREFQFRKKSGEKITGIFSADIITINNEKCVLSSINDITSRKRTEEALRESEQELRLITDNVRDTLWLMDMGMRTTWISPSVVRTRGYTLEELIEMPMDRHLAPESLVRMMELSSIHLTPERLTDPNVEISVNEELEYYRKDGSTFWADTLVALLRDKDGKPSGFLGVGRDITERKRTEEALNRSERKYRNMFENAPEGIFQSSPEGRYISVNPAFARIGGYDSPEEMINSVTDIQKELYVHQEDRVRLLELFNQQDMINNFEAEIRRKDNTIIWISMNVKPIRDQSGKIIILEGTIVDITERKKVEEEIKTLNRDLEQHVIKRTSELRNAQLALLNLVDDLSASTKDISLVNQALSATNKELEAFSYSVSHDLRAPLRGMDGFSQALLEDYGDKLDATGKNYLERIRTGTQRMGLLIDDMLKLSRINRIEFKRESIDFSKMVQDILLTVRQNEPARDVEMSIQKDIIIEGDRHLLEIALTNLLENAWKFTSKTKNARIEFGMKFMDGKPVMFIRDNGVGFDMAYVDKLFGAFQRLHTTAEFPGTGIGLATVQRVIHRHGGRIWAEGKMGRGAVFYFTLP